MAGRCGCECHHLHSLQTRVTRISYCDEAVLTPSCRARTLAAILDEVQLQVRLWCRSAHWQLPKLVFSSSPLACCLESQCAIEITGTCVVSYAQIMISRVDGLLPW